MNRILSNYADDLDGDGGYDGPSEADRGDWEYHRRIDRELENMSDEEFQKIKEEKG